MIKMTMTRETYAAAKAAIYEQAPNEAMVLLDSTEMSDEAIQAWRTGDAETFMKELQSIARDRAWSSFCADHRVIIKE